MEARAAMPIPTPMPIEAPVERLELALGGVDVEAGDEVDEALEETVAVYISSQMLIRRRA
jgi:hypothetical protein